MRTLLGTLTILLVSCSASGEGAAEPPRPIVVAATPAPVAPPVASAPVVAGAPVAASTGALTVDDARSYWQSGSSAVGARHFALEQWKSARRQFALALKAATTDDERARIRLMIALADDELGSRAAAAKGFARAVRELPIIADYTNYRAALSSYHAKNTKSALAHARAVSAGSVYRREATLLAGDVLRGQRKHAEIAAHYGKYIDGDHGGLRLAEARYRRAEALEALRRKPAELIGLYKEITSKAPLSSWGRRAQERLDALAKRVPSRERKKLLALSATDYINRGTVMYRNHRNQQSEAEFALALSAPGLDAESRCVAAYYRASSVYKQRDRKRAAPLFDEAINICNKSKNIDLQVKSAYQAGRSYGLTSRSETAINRYAQVEKRHPTHSYADDARLRQAEEYRDLNKQRDVTRLLASIPTKYPDGDMRAEAMWRLAWRAYKDAKYKESVKWLRKQIEVKPIDENYWAEGQAQYWLGRAYGKLGDSKKSMEAYREAVIRYPLTYYALLSLNRMREIDAAAFEAVKSEIVSPAMAAKANPFQFKARPVYQQAEFKSALELLRLGLGREAQRQLASLGFSVPGGKKEVTDPDEQDKIWAMAFLYHNAGRFGQSHWVTRWHVLGFKRHWPISDASKLAWRIAYPIAWWELLNRHATKNGYPPHLSISFVREESAFNPLQESFANAIGLTQMIFSTARRFAKGTGITVSRDTLRDPEKNVTIGSRFLAFLYNRYGGRIALLVPSYNAGEGATDRWLRYRGDWEMDAWSEEIPYDETRRYSKRVIASYFTYSFLHDGSIPVMPNNIPKDAVARAKKRR